MATNADQPILTRELKIQADHSQFYVCSLIEDDFENVFIDALADAHSSRRFVGAAGLGRCLDVMTPSQWNWDIPMRVELWAVEPPSDVDGWDHEVDIDFAVPAHAQRISFEASGGGAATAIELPSGDYRARISGSGYDASWLAHTQTRAGHETFRMQLWRRDHAEPPTLRKSWPGFDRYPAWVDYRQ